MLGKLLLRFATVAFSTMLFAQCPSPGIWKPADQRWKAVIEKRGNLLLTTVTDVNPDGSPWILKFSVPVKGGAGQVVESTGRFDSVTSTIVTPLRPLTTRANSRQAGALSNNGDFGLSPSACPARQTHRNTRPPDRQAAPVRVSTPSALQRGDERIPQGDALFGVQHVLEMFRRTPQVLDIGTGKKKVVLVWTR